MNIKRLWPELISPAARVNPLSILKTVFTKEKEMRNIEDIEKDLAAIREALAGVEGTVAEVYSRIVGYYRSVRNWNNGKREEYGERKMFWLPAGKEQTTERYAGSGPKPVSAAAAVTLVSPAQAPVLETAGNNERLLLFVRPACPACPGAKAAANRLGIPVDMVNADTEAGMEEAVRRQVFSTPTAILLTGDGRELGRALDAGGISALAAV
jgi:ribonucleoside-triphosphate reductase